MVTTPTAKVRYAIGNLEFYAYVHYIEEQFPTARFLDYAGSGYTLTSDTSSLLTVVTRPFKTYFDIQGFKEILVQTQAQDPNLWYERALNHSQSLLLDGLGIRNGAVLKVLCACCQGLLDGLGANERPFEFDGPTEAVFDETDKAVNNLLHSIYKVPLPVHGKEWEWLNGGSDEL